VDPADRAVLREPALPGGVMDHPAARWGLRPGYPLDDRRTQAAPNQISGGGGHPLILPPDPSPHRPPAAGPAPRSKPAEQRRTHVPRGPGTMPAGECVQWWLTTGGVAVTVAGS